MDCLESAYIIDHSMIKPAAVDTRHSEPRVGAPGRATSLALRSAGHCTRQAGSQDQGPRAEHRVTQTLG